MNSPTTSNLATPEVREGSWQALLPLVAGIASSDWHNDRSGNEICIYSDQTVVPPLLRVKKTHGERSQAALNEAIVGERFESLAADGIEIPRAGRVFRKQTENGRVSQEQRFVGFNLDQVEDLIRASDQPVLWREPSFQLSVWQGVISALQEIHQLGWVHADSKPDNFTLNVVASRMTGTANRYQVTLRPSEQAHVIDFGTSLLDRDWRRQQVDTDIGIPQVGHPPLGQADYVSKARYSEPMTKYRRCHASAVAPRSLPERARILNLALGELEFVDYRADFFSLSVFVREWLQRAQSDATIADVTRPSAGWSDVEQLAQKLENIANARGRTAPPGGLPILPHADVVNWVAERSRLLGASAEWTLEVSLDAPGATQDRPIRSPTMIIDTTKRKSRRIWVAGAFATIAALGVAAYWGHLDSPLNQLERIFGGGDVPKVAQRSVPQPAIPREIALTDPDYVACTDAGTMNRFDRAIRSSPVLPADLREQVAAALRHCRGALQGEVKPSPLSLQLQVYAAEYALYLGQQADARATAGALLRNYPDRYLGDLLLGKADLLEANVSSAWPRLRAAAEKGLPEAVITSEPQLFAPLRDLPDYPAWRARIRANGAPKS